MILLSFSRPQACAEAGFSIHIIYGVQARGMPEAKLGSYKQNHTFWFLRNQLFTSPPLSPSLFPSPGLITREKMQQKDEGWRWGGNLCGHKPLIKGNFQNVGIMVPDFMSGIPSILAFISLCLEWGITHVYSQRLSGLYRGQRG